MATFLMQTQWKEKWKMAYKSKYFTLEELLRSDTALSYRIENLPTWEDIEHLLELAKFLDEMREAYGKPIYVSSGLRKAKLNSRVGGVSTSIHQIGYAVDLYVKGGNRPMDKFIEWLKVYLKDKDFDQCITERSKTGTTWIHFGLYNNKHQQRHQLFDAVA